MMSTRPLLWRYSARIEKDGNARKPLSCSVNRVCVCVCVFMCVFMCLFLYIQVCIIMC